MLVDSAHMLPTTLTTACPTPRGAEGALGRYTATANVKNTVIKAGNNLLMAWDRPPPTNGSVEENSTTMSYH